VNIAAVPVPPHHLTVASPTTSPSSSVSRCCHRPIVPPRPAWCAESSRVNRAWA